MAKEFSYRGKSAEEVKGLSLQEFAKLLKSRARRRVLRGFSDVEKKLLERIKKFKDTKKRIKTQSRDMLVLPEMIGATVHIYNGRTYSPVIIIEDMLGHRLGEFALTRKEVKHKAPGIGATRSSKAVAVK